MGILNYLKTMLKKDYWIEPFPEEYPPECFDCNLITIEDCVNCEFNKEKKLNGNFKRN